MQHTRITERREIVGAFCELTRGGSRSSRWIVTFLGVEIGRFNNLRLARQFAEHRIWAFMRDAIEQGDSL
jgi:hypothetical protein